MPHLLRSLLLVSILCFSTTLVAEGAHAQSLPDFKKLKDKLTKKKEPEKKAPTATPSSRNDPLRNSRNRKSGNTKTTALNEDANSNLCFSGNGEHNVCIPKKAINKSHHFSVKKITLQIEDLINNASCTLGNTRPNEPKAGGVSFRVYCRNSDDTLYQANIKATPELYYVSDISVDVCGPQVVNGDSVFFKKIEKRYGSNSEMKLLKGHEMISFHSKDTAERMKVWKEPTGKFRDRSVQSKCFTDNGTLWHFQISANQGEEFKSHLKNLLMSKQSAGDDF